MRQILVFAETKTYVLKLKLETLVSLEASMREPGQIVSPEYLRDGTLHFNSQNSPNPSIGTYALTSSKPGYTIAEEREADEAETYFGILER